MTIYNGTFANRTPKLVEASVTDMFAATYETRQNFSIFLMEDFPQMRQASSICGHTQQRARETLLFQKTLIVKRESCLL